MYKYKNAYKRNKFENNGADRNISILFQSFIQPLHTKGVEKDQNTHDEKQRLFCLSRGVKNMAAKKAAYDRKQVIILIIRTSCTVRLNFSRSSLTFAHTRIPYVGMPSWANMVK